jgi:uncharacterized peroxidase-related enzyme
MAFIRTVPADKAEGILYEIYQEDMKTKGYVANHTSAFSLRPEVYRAWQNLLNSIRSKMRLRRFELVTLAAAQALKCTYCMLAHGAVLKKNFFSASELAEIAKDFRNSGLPVEEVALMEFAQKVTLEPNQITSQDIDLLREKGLSDEEILDVVLTVTARNFMSKTLDALGAEPDAALMELEPELREALVIGRAL